jgi:hypothetical protein
MQSLRPGLAVALCCILLGACLLTAETSPVPSASSGESGNEVGNTLSTDKPDREVFDTLVKLVENSARAATDKESRAKCPYKTLSFDGVTHVMCDYPECHDSKGCDKQLCHQVYAFWKRDTHNITKEEPKSGNYGRVYIGCIYEGKAGVESTDPPVTKEVKVRTNTFLSNDSTRHSTH